MLPLTDEKRAEYKAFIDNLSAEDKDRLAQEFSDILAFEIDREYCREDNNKSPEDEITDDEVRQWRIDRDLRIVQQLKEFAKNNNG